MLSLLSLVLLLFTSSVSCESVRETETWMPMRSTQTVASSHGGDLEASGGAANGSDFGFADDEDEDDEDYLDEDELDEDEDSSGSGDGATEAPGREAPGREAPGREAPGREAPGREAPGRGAGPTAEPDDHDDNRIPEPAPPGVHEPDAVQTSNDILSKEAGGEAGGEPSNVLMAHAGEDSVFNKTEVLAALVAGGVVGVASAVLLLLLLVHRLRKKDEGSYDLGRKPIYTRTPTAEIYA